MANLKLKNVFKRFEGGVVAVNNFNLDINDKEFLVLVGPSGCGKSTTLRMIAGLEEITEGEIYIGDKLVNDMQPKDRDIAMVFQSYALYPHMTVFDNMAFGLKLRKTPKDEIKRKVQEAARILQIEHLLDRKPKALSGGQKQRVALGRAIVREPKVFLMDEPLSNLDAKLRAEMRIEISRIYHKLQVTMIYVTHDQIEAMTMGTRIVVIKDGFIQQVDTPQTLYEKPCNAFVAGFIGSPKMNFFDVEVEKEGADYILKFNEYRIKLPEGKAKRLEGKDYVGKKVIMGIRPEDVHDEAMYLDTLKESTLSAEVSLVEALGAETLIYMTIDEVDMIARVNPRTQARVGEKITIALDPNKIHLFDKETELVIIN